MSEQLFAFLLGIMAGIGLVMIYIQYKVSQIRGSASYTEAKKFIDDVKKKAGLPPDSEETLESKLEKISSIKDKLIRAGQIAQQQAELRDAAQQPSKNAMHSRYKNGLIGEMSKLENEKNDILKSILDEGFDPTITVVDSAGEQKQMTLSEYLSGNQSAMEEEVSKDPNAPRKVGKFTVHNGGKPDGGETTH